MINTYLCLSKNSTFCSMNVSNNCFLNRNTIFSEAMESNEILSQVAMEPTVTTPPCFVKGSYPNSPPKLNNTCVRDKSGLALDIMSITIPIVYGIAKFVATLTPIALN